MILVCVCDVVDVLVVCIYELLNVIVWVVVVCLMEVDDFGFSWGEMLVCIG